VLPDVRGSCDEEILADVVVLDRDVYCSLRRLVSSVESSNIIILDDMSEDDTPSLNPVYCDMLLSSEVVAEPRPDNPLFRGGFTVTDGANIPGVEPRKPAKIPLA
jgi:hypothetical protein